MPLLPVVLLLLIVPLAFAGEADVAEPRQELRQLLEEIDRNEQHNAQQKAELRRLERKMECNWALIRSYELCDQLYANAPQDHLTCTRRARQNAAHCLAEAEKPATR